MTPRKKVMTHGVLAHTWVYDLIFCPLYEHNREAQASRYANKGVTIAGVRSTEQS